MTKPHLTEIAKAIGAILGVPLALFAVVNSIIAQPVTSLIVALITAALVSVWVILSRWVSITQIITAWLALAVVVLAGFVIWPTTMTVEGFVRNTTGTPVIGEEVVCLDQHGQRYEATTDADGHYQFTGVPTGKYKLRVCGSEIEGETKGILVRVIQQNLTVSEILATAPPTSVAAVTPNTLTATLIPPTNTPVAKLADTSEPELPTNTPIPGPTDTPTSEPPIPSSATPTPTVHPMSMPPMFVVLRDGIKIRQQPSRWTSEVVAYGYARQEVQLLPASTPTRDSAEGIKWWPIIFNNKQVWIGELIDYDKRQLKPKLNIGDEVQVANPLCIVGSEVRSGRGRAILHTPFGEKELDWGTRLLIIDGPLPLFSEDNDDRVAAGEGRQWWQVRVLGGDDDVRPGEEGWIADFASSYKQLLIAPEWYITLSALVAKLGEDQLCP